MNTIPRTVAFSRIDGGELAGMGSAVTLGTGGLALPDGEARVVLLMIPERNALVLVMHRGLRVEMQAVGIVDLIGSAFDLPLHPTDLPRIIRP